MMPIHYFHHPTPRRHNLRKGSCSSIYSKSPVDSPEDSETEDEVSPKNSDIKRSGSFTECIYQFFGSSDKESEAKDTDTSFGPVYGDDLEKVRKSSNIPHVPVLIVDICSIVEEKYLCTEGLYSVFEKKYKLRKVISMVKFEYDREKLAEMEPHILAGLLKAFLKGLKTPVLGADLAGMVLTIGHITEIPMAKKIKLFARQRKHMSKASQATLYYLLHHLNKVLHHQEDNKLNLHILCRNFVSSFFPGFFIRYDLKRNPAAMQFLVVYYNDLIFPSDAKEICNSPQHTGPL